MSELTATHLEKLRRPFTPAAVRWKVQVGPKGTSGRAMVVAYIDARLVAERLNHVCPGLWSDEFAQVDGGMMCKLTVAGVTRCDVGWSKNTNTDIDLKALYSDAFKRAGVKFGIGVSIYALPQVFVPASELDGGKYIGNKAKAKLARSYEAWLKSHGRQAFGEPLDHGDSEGAQGDVETEEREGAEGEALFPPNARPLNKAAGRKARK